CDNGGRSKSRSLILHWDGVHWRNQVIPNLGGGNSDLTAVHAVSSTEAWAVGSHNVGGAIRSLVLHFTGGQWHKVRIMNVNVNDSLSAVTATSATDVWAVGFGFSAGIVQSVHGRPAIGHPAIGRAATGRAAIGRAGWKTDLRAPKASPS